MLGRVLIEAATRGLPEDEVQRRRATEWALELRRRHPSDARVQRICEEILREIQDYEDGLSGGTAVVVSPGHLRHLFLELSDLGRL